ncbi:DUF6163 family protein [Roseibium salinum]|uniref:DUF6163 family protein n=1 Tax=Roseibium salinum TaxID=1604349 RepID=UPI003617EB02
MRAASSIGHASSASSNGAGSGSGKCRSPCRGPSSFAVLDLVAATGLWLTVTWGTVMWLFRCFCQIVMHTAFSDLYGRRPYEITFYLLTIAIFALLAYLMGRENREAAG